MPTSLAGTTLTVAGLPAPLVSVSPGSITFQAPASLVPHTTDPNIVAAIVVTNPLGASDPVQVLYAYVVPGLYTQSGLGCEIGLVNNESLAGLITLKCQKNSASPGDFISVFGTRFGLAGVSLSDGEALPQGAEGGIISGSGRI